MTTEIDNSIDLAQPARAWRAKPTATITTVQPAPSKADTLVKLLLRAKGATALELKAATAWQPHSIRAFLSGLRKKGRVIAREARAAGLPSPVAASPICSEIGFTLARCATSRRIIPASMLRSSHASFGTGPMPNSAIAGPLVARRATCATAICSRACFLMASVGG